MQIQGAWQSTPNNIGSPELVHQEFADQAEHAEPDGQTTLPALAEGITLVDLGCRRREIAGIRVLHRGKPKRISKAEKRLLERRQAVEPSIGHLKAAHRMSRNLVKSALGAAMNPFLAGVGFNIHWLVRWLVIFWCWILSGVLRLLDQSGLDACSNVKLTAEQYNIQG